ncbi:hypothetical protein HNR60_001511 [Rhodopseudomonas rhenobacensis]|uniref:Uncharacterized protein n=1 Tax=Rhodopseudomonas rhenobacensis TaxID=87461 RepID=A0A7W7Z2D5_9BRAD|nr:hypothetical protein [Rhodopseudomonas rhenobacensis]MBB5046763.1 hypothetical protein [Rhodopseudomonas rhenobacensis]
MTDKNGKGPFNVHPFLKIIAAFRGPWARNYSSSSDELQKQISDLGAANLLEAMAISDKLEKVFSTKIEPSIRIACGEETKTDHPFLKPAPPPKPQPHYENVEEMLGLLDGEWKCQVHPVDRTTDIEHFVSLKIETGHTWAFKVVLWSLVDRRVRIAILVSPFQLLQTAHFECDSEKFGFKPEITTCSDDPFLDLCKVVIAGKLDRYNHAAGEDLD